jgi:hypothetical protein
VFLARGGGAGLLEDARKGVDSLVAKIGWQLGGGMVDAFGAEVGHQLGLEVARTSMYARA